MDLNFLKLPTTDTQLQTIESQLDECGDIFSSLLNSQNEWHQTPEIIHLTFKSIGEFMEKLDKKITHNINYLSTAFSRMLRQKVDTEELEAKFSQNLRHHKQTEKSQSIEFKLRREEGLDLETIEEIRNIAYTAIENKLEKFNLSPTPSPGKEEYHNILEITELFNKELSKIKDSVKVCETKLMNQALLSPEKRLNQQISNLKSQLFELQKNVDRKLTERVMEMSEINERQQRDYVERVESERDTRVEYVMSEMETLRRMMEDILRTKMDRKEYTDFKGKVNKQIGDKIKLQEVQEIVKSIQSQLENRIQDIKSEIKSETKKIQKSLAKQTRQQTDELKKTIQKLVQLKQYSSNNQKSNNNKASLNEIKLSLGKIERRISDKILDTKQDIPEIKEQVSQELKRFWKKVEGELELRDQKLCETIQQSKDTLRTQYRTVRTKSKQTTVNKQHQKLLNQLNSQLLQGKWISTRLNNQKHCVWERQLVNTMTENFIWEANIESLVLVAAGVYRIEFGFFSPTGSFPSVIINGEVAFKKLQSKQKQIMKHPNGYVNGVTMVEMILVPPRAKISIQMSKQENGETFLAIYKL